MNDTAGGAQLAPVLAPAALLQAVLSLRAEVTDAAADVIGAWRPHIVREEFLRCAGNLACYLALRRHDLSRLQQELARWGVSSLGRSEAHVIPSIDAVTATLASIAGVEPPARVRRPAAADYDYGSGVLQAQKHALFGADPGGPTARIMVTLPAEAASDAQLCATLIAAGVDSARINCAHDHVHLWRGMAANMRAAAAGVGRTCAILADLGGSKVRIDRVSGASPLRVRRGDRFTVAVGDGEEGERPTVWCSDRTLLQNLRVGASLWVDDGKIGCVVEQAGAERALLRVTAAREKGNLLKPGKGLSCLDGAAAASALTAQDRIDLAFVVEHADMVGYSFV